MTVRVALDLLGGDGAPSAVLAAAGMVADDQPDVELTLVGPPELAGDRFPVVPAYDVVGVTDDPTRAVRAKRDATLRVAARLVRDGAADATVSAGPAAAAAAAAVFTLGRTPGVVTLAVQVGSLVLVDDPAAIEAGMAYAKTLGITDPEVGVLSPLPDVLGALGIDAPVVVLGVNGVSVVARDASGIPAAVATAARLAS